MEDEVFDEEDRIFFEAAENLPNLVEIRRGLEKLAEKITLGDIGKSELFQGADIMVVPRGFTFVEPRFGDLLVIETEYSEEMSWLIYQLRDCFVSFLDFQNKFWFYGTVAQAAQVCIAAQAPAQSEDLVTTLEGPLRVGFHVCAALERLFVDKSW